MRYILAIFLILMLVVGVQAASLNKTSASASMKLDPKSVSVDYKDIKHDITFTHDTMIDDKITTPAYVDEKSESEIWMDGKDEKSSEIVMKYDHFANETLKGTIVIKKPHKFVFRYSTNGHVVDHNGGLRIIRNTKENMETLNDWKKGFPAGVDIPAPTAVDAGGKNVPVWYTLDKENIYLHMNDSIAEYPLTIDPTYYLSEYDAYWKLGMHCNATPFIDSSPSARTISNSEWVALNTTSKKFGAGSCWFTGNATSALSVPGSADWNLGGTWTAMMYINGTTVPDTVIYKSSSDLLWFGGHYGYADAFKFVTISGGGYTAAYDNYSLALPANGNWTQLVFGQNSTTPFLYVNGVSTPITTSTAGNMGNSALNTYPMNIGNVSGVGDYYYNGSLDEFNIWNGVAIPIGSLYPPAGEVGVQNSTAAAPVANFTGNQTLKSSYSMPVQFNDTSTNTPTTRNWTFGDGYTSTSQNPLHFYSVAGQYTVSLNVTNADGFNSTTKTNYITLSSDNGEDLKSWLHFNNSATTDLKGNVWTATGAVFSTARSRFGGGSLLIGGNDERLTTPSSTSLNIPNNFALEFWIFPISVNKATNIVSRTGTDGTGTTNGWGLHNNGSASGYTFWMGSYSANATPTFAIPNGSWSHVAVQRIDNNINISVNGTLVASRYQPGSYDTTNLLRIGSKGPGTEANFYMNEFRLSSTDRWNAWSTGFSTPYAQYNGIVGALADQNQNSTLRYKTDPTSVATIYNQSYGGVRNRTVQIQNATRLNNITVSVNYDPLTTIVKGVYANKTDYSDMSVQSYSIDNTNGIATAKVNRTDENNPIVANLDTRINLVDFQMFYYNYTSEQNVSTFFTNSVIGDNRTAVDYPVENFVMTPVTYGEWGLYPEFAADTTTPSIGQTVTFTDSTLGAINGWSIRNYSWGGGSWTNETWASATTTHAYSTTGLKTVSLYTALIANGSISNSTTRIDYINVSAANNLTQQNVGLIQQFTLYLTVNNANTAAPISGALVLDNLGNTYTTGIAGNVSITYPYSVAAGTVSSTGYFSGSYSAIMDNDTWETVSLVQQSNTTTPSQSTWYTQHTVRIRVIDNYGRALPNVALNVSYVNTTLPSTNVSWLTSAFGISAEVASQMTNSGLAMTGNTGDDGTQTFMMFPAISYRVEATNATMGVSCQRTFAPQGSDYAVKCPTTGQDVQPTYLAQTLNRSYIWISEPNSSWMTIHAQYQDPTAATTNVQFNVTCRDNGTVVYSRNLGNPGTSTVLANFTMPIVRGAQYTGYISFTRP